MAWSPTAAHPELHLREMQKVAQTETAQEETGKQL